MLIRTRLIALLLTVAGAQNAHAFPQVYNDWIATYGASSASGANAGCQLCHANANGGDPWNGYGWDLRVARGQSACDSDADGEVSNVEAFRCIEFFNSDEDVGQNDNLAEILASAQPGWSIGSCNTLYSVTTTPAQPAPADIGALDPAGTPPTTDCPTDPGDPGDPGDATIVTVRNGESIQAAIDAVAPGSTILIEPGVYTETSSSQNALSITKSGIRLIGMVDGDNGVVLQPSGSQNNGIVVVPANRTDCLSCHSTLAPPFSVWPDTPPNVGTEPLIDGFEIRNVTIQGFVNNGLFTERVENFEIVNVHSVDNTNYGIFPTLSSRGVIQHSSATGADDSGIWVETSTDVRVSDSVVSGNVNGVEVSNSDRITIENNLVENNTVGISLFVLTDLVDERPGANKVRVSGNTIINNNKPNSGTPGSIVSVLPPGIGVLVLGVDNSVIENNYIEDNDFFGIVLADYCLSVQGTSYDCSSSPPPAEFDPVPERNKVRYNTLVSNGDNPDPGSPFSVFAADITLFVQGDYGNCFLDNTLTTFLSITGRRNCGPLGLPYASSSRSDDSSQRLRDDLTRGARATREPEL